MQRPLSAFILNPEIRPDFDEFLNDFLPNPYKFVMLNSDNQRSFFFQISLGVNHFFQYTISLAFIPVPELRYKNSKKAEQQIFSNDAIRDVMENVVAKRVYKEVEVQLSVFQSLGERNSVFCLHAYS